MAWATCVPASPDIPAGRKKSGRVANSSARLISSPGRRDVRSAISCCAAVLSGVDGRLLEMRYASGRSANVPARSRSEADSWATSARSSFCCNPWSAATAPWNPGWPTTSG